MIEHVYSIEEQIPNRHERRKQRTRRQLKEAALALVLEKGYDEVTIQHIVDRSDLGRGTFYIHYHDKQDILWDIIQDGLLESMQQGHQRVVEGGERPGYTGYLLTFETAARHRDLYRVMLGSQGSALVTNRVADYLAAEMQKNIEKGEFLAQKDMPPAVLAQYAVGALMRLTLWWLETENEYTPQQMADMLYALVHGDKANPDHLDSVT